MNQDKATPKQVIFDYTMLTLATLIMSAGIYFFKFPNHFSTGGVSGISIILGEVVPSLSPGAFVFIINQALLLIGFLFLGKSFGIRTAYVSLLMSGVIWGLEVLFPMTAPMTNEPLLELVFSVALPAIGSAILFNMQASSGGTDIIAMLLKRKTSINIGNCLLMVDFLITVAACAVFGMETGLFSILGLALKSVIVDMVLENIKVHKCFQVITSKPDEIITFIVNELHRGATRIKGEGAFTHEDKTVILTVVNRPQAVLLRKQAKIIDPSCFILITNTTEILGKGFRGLL
ncbi:MAG: YitT family protein [Clostridia bacterium]|nr:YitT family protein [Clostridia bacterium]